MDRGEELRLKLLLIVPTTLWSQPSSRWTDCGRSFGSSRRSHCPRLYCGIDGALPLGLPEQPCAPPLFGAQNSLTGFIPLSGCAVVSSGASRSTLPLSYRWFPSGVRERRKRLPSGLQGSPCTGCPSQLQPNRSSQELRARVTLATGAPAPLYLPLSAQAVAAEEHVSQELSCSSD